MSLPRSVAVILDGYVELHPVGLTFDECELAFPWQRYERL